MTNILRPALVMFTVLTLATGVAYPLVVTGAAQSLFPAQAGGSLILRDGKAVGSER
jgi:K+-transporting ATPase ATPase C chain